VSGRPLRVLLVEDSPDDATLLLLELRRGGFDVTSSRVDTAEATAAALPQADWDLVIADFSMPGFSGVEALDLVRAHHADVPFMFVSGTMGEELAVRAMKLGASDYFVKGNLKRLCPAIDRELRDADTRRERRQVEQALSESESRYKELFDANPHPMWVHDAESGAMLAVNAAALRGYGYTAAEFLGLTIGDIAAEVVPEGDPLPAGAQQHFRKNGDTIDVEVSSHAIRFGGREARLVVATDVSERRDLESQLRQAQKMQAIGQLAGGVAHDFNNVLSVILGYGEAVLASLDASDENHAAVAEIVRAGERAALLTRQLLAFSRRQHLAPRILDLDAALADMDAMLRRLVGEAIEMQLRAAGEPGLVRIDPAQIQQVVINLVVNARDAMPAGGRLVIETATVWLDEEYGRRHVGVTPGPHVMLCVIDSGVGIAPETMPHIFEPFFTTKDVGQGTGLGLATVYAIASGAGGHVWAYSEPGRGTAVKVYLPCVEGVPEDLRQRETGEMPAGSETILVVEDEPGVRDLMRKVLESLGYTVMLAGNPAEGRARAEELGDRFALLVTDVVMPGGTGPDLARTLAATRPGLPVLYVSGYTADAAATAGALDAGGVFLAKPFTRRALAHAVRALLDGGPPAGHGAP
jgi:two-component system, cell cycle sensor histidine kinase and response regulator CckA